MNVLILAAGYATRLYPLTLNKAKPLLDVAGKPMIEWVLDNLAPVPDIQTVYVVTNNKFAADFQAWADGYVKRASKMSFKIVNDGSTSDQDKLGAIEPFRTAVELASKRGGTTAGEVAQTLGAQGIQWHYKPDLNESLVKNLLIHWTIRADLLSYDGKSEKFQSASPGMDPSGEGHRA